MSIVAITRLKPAYLQQVQIQANVGNNGTIANVIKSLQFNNNSPVLNTNCPTCAVEGAAKGFVTASLHGNTVKTPCPTCKGYLLYHTTDGAVTPPTNPFNAPIVVTRLLPADLVEALDGFPSSTTLSTMIASLQANVATPPTHNCPVCTHTGWITVNANKAICWLCNGVQKTVNEYTYTSGVLVRVFTPPVLPNPRIPPPGIPA